MSCKGKTFLAFPPIVGLCSGFYSLFRLGFLAVIFFTLSLCSNSSLIVQERRKANTPHSVGEALSHFMKSDAAIPAMARRRNIHQYFNSQIIFCFYYYRMKNTDNQKGTDTYYESVPVHLCSPLFFAALFCPLIVVSFCYVIPLSTVLLFLLPI